MPRRFYVNELCLESAIGILIVIPSRSSIQVFKIFLLDFILSAITNHFVKKAEFIEDFLKNILAIEVLSVDLFEGNRIGSIRTENSLIHIHSRTDDAVADVLALQVALDECATDFLIFEINVVRPFHLQMFINTAYRQSNSLTQDELARRKHEIGMTHDGKGEILPDF